MRPMDDNPFHPRFTDLPSAAPRLSDDPEPVDPTAAAELRGLPLDHKTTVPILVMHTASGPVAVDGPLVDPAPGPNDAGALWDAFTLLAGAEGMFGATRPPRGPHSSVAALAGAALIEGKMP